jgi:hypothetical protein
MNCACIESLKKDESGKIAEYLARQKATVKKIDMKQIAFPLVKKEDGSTELRCTTLSVLEVETNEKKKPLKIDILHSYCPFCGVKYS